MAGLDQFSHPAWRTVVGMGVSYLIILTAILVVLFLVPYVLFLGL